jgi:hypothetical protein
VTPKGNTSVPVEARLTALEVRICDLVRDPQYQVRRRLDHGAVQRYAAVYQSGGIMPPVNVAKVAGGAGGWAYVLTDGWHRVAALEHIGHTKVSAVVTEATENEARWLAAQANLTHGVPLKPKEYREVLRAYVRAGRVRTPKGRLKSYRDIAAEMGGATHFTTVRRWIVEDFPKLAREMGGGDKLGGNGMREGNPEANLAKVATDAVANAVAAARGITDPERRGAIICALEEALASIRAGGAFNIANPLDNPDF